MALPPLAVLPETTEVLAGNALQLRLNNNALHAGDVELVTQWFRNDTPLDGQHGNSYSIPAAGEQHGGMYRVVVQTFVGANFVAPASIEISEPAFVFVTPREQAAGQGDATCCICLNAVKPGDAFRFRRRAEESFHSGFRTLSAAGRFDGELQFCSHDFHRSCVQSYAEHAILREGRWCVRCPNNSAEDSSARCAYLLYSSDIRELCGATSQAFTSFCDLKSKDFKERVRQVRAGEEVDAATRDWMVANCDVCPGCQAIVYRDAGCRSITCTCDARFVHGEHRGHLS